MSTGSGRGARRIALAAVTAVLDDHRALGDAGLFEPAGDAREQAFARRLAWGTLRWLGALEWLSTQLLDRPLRRKDRDIARLVQIGLYQLWKEDVPGHAAVHATAEVAKGMRKAWAVGLVNAVLRRFSRERDELLDQLSHRPERLAHPAWLLDALERDWPDQWSAIADAGNREPPLWLRCNRLRATPAELAPRLEAAGFTATTHPEVTDALKIEPAAPVDRIPGFREGLCSVQDPAAQLAAALIAPRPGARVLDACAAPGGKACHLLETAPDIELTALDLDRGRLTLIRENLERLSLKARLLAADAAEPETWWGRQPFDRILLDAPCSATGVIRRHPEIKWLRNPGQVDAATGLQARLLDKLWPLLRPGGILVYATCSVLKRENSQQIQCFLASHDDARCIGPDAAGSPDDGPGRQIPPGDADMDGFYYAVLHRSA